MKKMNKTFTILTLIISLAGCSNVNEVINNINENNIKQQKVNEDKKIKNVIMFIGDGMGVNHVDAGGIYKGEPLSFDVTDENWTYHAYSNTDSLTSAGFTLDESKSLIRPDENPSLYDGTPSPYDPSVSLGASGNITTYTDSAAGGTALATGQKTTNSRIAKDYNGDDIESLVDIAKGLNKKAGVISSDTLCGATPSAFLAHAGDRYQKDEIIKTAAESPADLIFTANDSAFVDNKSTYESLFKSKGYKMAYTRETINSNADRIIGLFDGIVTKSNDSRAPSLKELTVFALDYLDNDEGFFLMVEGAKIDKKAHSNQAKLMLLELLAFDEAIEAAMEWASGRDDTIMVVTADHETGAMYYDYENSTQETIVDDIKWLSSNHSRSRVDIALYGNVSEYTNLYASKFKTLEGLPYWDNTDVKEIVKKDE